TSLLSYRFFSFYSLIRRLQRSALFPYTTLFRSLVAGGGLIQPCRGCVCRLTAQGPLGKPTKLLPGSFGLGFPFAGRGAFQPHDRSEEHTSELQSQSNLVCRLLLEKKKKRPLSQS